MSVDQFLLSADTTDLNYPEIRPTLDLNFARSKTLDPRITFTRASGGSYVGADGLIKYVSLNQPRFDHDPITGESLGLLVEGSRTNFTTQSENFSDNIWIKSGASINVNVIGSPDGNQTADEILCNLTDSFNGRTTRTVSAQNGNYTISFYAKKGRTDWLMITIETASRGGRRCWYNLNTGKIGSNLESFGGVWDFETRMEDAGNGWYRCSITVNINTGAGTLVYYAMCPNDNLNVTSNSGNSIYIWGAQLERGAFPTSYIPTQTSTRTRVEDNAVIGGNEFLNIFNENEGTFFSKSKTSGEGSGAFFVGDVNTQQIPRNYIDILRYQNDFLRAGIGLETEGTSVVINSTLPLRQTYKASHAYNLNRSVLYVNGNLIGRVNSRTRIIPKDLKVLQIGTQRVSALQGFYLNGHIYRLTYFNRLLPDSQLQALTR